VGLRLGVPNTCSVVLVGNVSSWLVDAIVTNLVNRLGSVGDGFKGR
jgi:hypothetical protein